jgi:hypothetical protein
MSNEAGTFVRIRGVVSKKPHVLEKVAFLSVTVEAGRYPDHHEIKCFDRGVMSDIANLGEGEQVTVDGQLVKEKLMVDKNPILNARGKAVYVPFVKATSVKPGWGDGKSSPPPRPNPPPPPPPADDIPW